MEKLGIANEDLLKELRAEYQQLKEKEYVRSPAVVETCETWPGGLQWECLLRRRNILRLGGGLYNTH